MVCYEEGWWVFLVCKFLADREQFRAFLFLVCNFLADQEHLGAYAGAQNGNCRVAGQLMRLPSTGTTQAQAPSNYPQQLSNRQSKDYRKENRANPPILPPGKC